MKRGKNYGTLNRRNFLKAAGTGLAVGVTGFPAIITNSAKPVFADVKTDLPKRELGKTGMMITTIALGSHINPVNQRDPEGRVKQLRAAFEMGMNMFDVYEHTYGQFGNTSKALETARQKVHISLAWVPPKDHNKNNPITPKIIRQVVEESLRAFKTDYIDMYRIVNVISEMHRDEMQKLRAEGKIRALGYAAHYEKEFVDAVKLYDLDFIMPPFNPIMNKLKYRKLFPLLKKKNIGIVGIKPFASGSLFKLKKNSPMLKKIELKKGASLAQAILKYIINQKEITTTIPAMNSVEEMKENLGVFENMALDWFDMEMLDNARHTAMRLGPSYLPSHYRWLHTEWIA